MLDHKVTIQYHVNKKMKKTMKGIGVLRKLKPTLSRFYQSILLQPSNDTFFLTNSKLFNAIRIQQLRKQ